MGLGHGALSDRENEARSEIGDCVIVWRMSLRRAALAFALVSAVALALPGSAAADLPAGVADGKIDVRVVPVSGSDTPSIVVTATVNSPPEKVWAVVSDCAHYKDRLPRVAASKQIAQNGNVVTCEVTIDMPFPFSNLTATTEATHVVDGKHFTRSWHLVKGDYKVNDGSWDVRPFKDDGSSSVIVYTVHAEPNTIVPDAIREKAQKKSLPEMIERVRKEAAKI